MRTPIAALSISVLSRQCKSFGSDVRSRNRLRSSLVLLKTGRVFTVLYALSRRPAGPGGLTTGKPIGNGYFKVTPERQGALSGWEYVPKGFADSFRTCGIMAVESASSPAVASTGYAGWRPRARFLAGWRGRLRVSPFRPPYRNGRLRRKPRQAWRAAPVRVRR
jgi:hypothetical protein